jgi:signal transduction histidine kinase
VARHSRSSTAWVRAVHSSDHLRLEIGDRGIGLPEGASSGLGLVAMRERAEILHGTLHFRRPPEGGTLVVLDVPLAEEMA